jgi:glucokinase
MNFLGIEIGGTKLQIVAGTGEGEILERVRFAVERAEGAEGIRRRVADTLPGLMNRWQPAAIAAGYGGPVDWRTGRIARSYHITGWNGFPLRDWLQEQTGLPAFVENDSNVAALAEAQHGAGRGFNPMMWVNVGSGIGAGLVVDGRLYHGAVPGEIELGHLRLERDGTIVEDRCSGWSLDRKIVSAIADAPETPLARLVGMAEPGGEARHLGPALAQGCPLAARIFDDAMQELAFAFSHAVHLLHPEIIVLGGGVALIGEPVRAALARALPRWIMDAFQPGPKLVLAALAADAVPVGALTLAAARI